ncbi:hypothetical protein [Prescottella agglutinans]|uniref:Uncharacterized protein n=1 Tax=Prescottella agglutinans TaxID=1644129 RepID=A0ABT6MI41_9NOCA|nr:hypothetical protein [Prescottella agglutinans]MDH6283980.1 hypothetical protein [Prescottella agglutinans]
MAHPIRVPLTRPVPCARRHHPEERPARWSDRVEEAEAALLATVDRWMNAHPAAATALAIISLAAVVAVAMLAVVASSV